MTFSICVKNYFTENELLISLKSMQNNKMPGNEGLTKEIYETFWNEIKYVFLKSLKQAKEKCQFSISQRRAVIKLTEKKIETKGTLKIGDQYLYLTLIRKLSKLLAV